jgi:alcohol dehydrogenase
VVGEGVKKFKVGDEVFGLNTILQKGAQSEYVVAHESQLHFKPTQLTHIEAASIPYVGLLAEGVFEHAPFKSKVFIHGGSGGFGVALMQLLKTRECEIHVTCSAKNFQKAKHFGANFVYDYRSADYLHLPESYFDLFVDSTISENILPVYITKIKPSMTYVNIHPHRNMRSLSFGNVFHGMFTDFMLGTKFSRKKIKNYNIFIGASAPTAGPALAHLCCLIEEGKFRTHFDKTFSFAKSIEAYEYYTTSARSGKVVINFDGI